MFRKTLLLIYLLISLIVHESAVNLNARREIIFAQTKFNYLMMLCAVSSEISIAGKRPNRQPDKLVESLPEII